MFVVFSRTNKREFSSIDDGVIDGVGVTDGVTGVGVIDGVIDGVGVGEGHRLVEVHPLHVVKLSVTFNGSP